MLECDRCNAKDLPEKTHTDHTYLYCRSQAKKILSLYSLLYLIITIALRDRGAVGLVGLQS